MPDTITLNNGVEMPALGLGVFQTPPEETARRRSRAALETGYRHIDTAAAYGNEREVGEAIRASGVDRAEVFIETKIWISDYGYDETLHGFEKSAGKLGVDQIDLLILHQALPTDFDRTIGAYRALETAARRRQGARHRRQQLHGRPPHRSCWTQTTVVPAVNQIEVHPYFQQREVQAFDAAARHPDPGVVADRRHHLLPRRRPHQHPRGPGHRAPSPRRTARRPAQVMLRWHLQQGRSASSRSRPSPHRIAENFDVFDFELTADELAAIDALDTGTRGGPEPEDVTLETLGFPIPEA